MQHATVTDGTLDTPHDATYFAVASFLSRYGNNNTRQLYEIDLRIFVQWCSDHGLRPMVDVKRVHVELFGRHLEIERGNGPATVAHRLNVVKTFYDYCEIDELIARNPARHVRLPKVWTDDTKKIGLDRHETGALIQQARATDPARHAMVVLMAMCGLRVSEACNVQIEDFHGREIQGHRVLVLIGKGNKPATIPLPPSVFLTLAGCANGRTHGPLLLRAIAILLPHAGMFDNQTTQRHLLIAQQARLLAEQYGAALVNWWPMGHNSWDWMNQQSYWSDGASAGGVGTDKGHPNDAGYQWMYDTLTAALLELLG